ncbi:glycoside hydrolase family 85 protein [Armillaria novae-zelandiae]|uniref:Glycoside hydrolase family 85 protein n=1 Tax=Armillaria novae-zelandiae TaxID=153914 RepID=A0AA39PTL6_9AGAR|nr:glycoside hydrolase family 85 protein [Armillaria novae-zelandiae]
MPIRGSVVLGNSLGHSTQYFKSLEELDAWTDNPTKKLTTPLKYHPRKPKAEESNPKGKLLVCHDYKGGYTESPVDLSYTFNYWSACDSFIYFSHHCVTIPPHGWITAAHRQGVKMLGTLIFEGGAEPDCLRLLVGKLPKSSTGPAVHLSSPSSIPVSPHYARVLAELAEERGFDGYLLNFDFEQTRALSTWITILQSEMRNIVGPHSEVVWYDSIIVSGKLAWQDRLNSLNLPFFLSSQSFFSNYTWRNDYPNLTAQISIWVTKMFCRALHPSLNNFIYVGVDVWGRGSHGGGGFGSYKAITHISPDSLGLSVALFGQAWTWESEQDKPGWTWQAVNNDEVPVPQVSKRTGEPDCTHWSLSSPSRRSSTITHPPIPCTSLCIQQFSPGVGHGCEKGWTDVDKQTSVGDLVWPQPVIAWEGEDGDISLRLSLTDQGSPSVYRCIWLPTTYEATAFYKLDVAADLDVSLSVKSSAEDTVTITPLTGNDTTVAQGWVKLSIQFSVPSSSSSASIGLVIAIVTEDPSESLAASLLLGQLNVFRAPSPSPSSSPMILWADYSSQGALTWEVAASLPATVQRPFTSAEDPVPLWDIQPCRDPSFLYYNVYASPFSSPTYAGRPEDATWIGTSGYSGDAKKFVVESPVKTRTRFYVQGVTEHGDVLPWERCVFVDSPVL